MNIKWSTARSSLLIFGALTLTSCAGTNKNDQVIPAASRQAPAPTTNPALRDQGVRSDSTAQNQSGSSLDALQRGEKATAGGPLKEVFFDFDRYELSSDARATLKSAADWLKQNPTVRVDIEGHSDERGTTEYNLALGAKRAQAAKDYLVTLGVGANRISTTSYGEEIPACQEHTESCWQKNRRDRFVAISAKPGA